MKPWVSKVFTNILPKILCIERPRKDAAAEAADEPIEVLTDVFHGPGDVDKFASYGEKRFSGDYGVPGERDARALASRCQIDSNHPNLRAVLPPSRFDVAASGGVGPCFGEPPLPALPLPGGDDELFSPSAIADGNNHLQAHHLHLQHHQHDLQMGGAVCCAGADGADISPTYDKAPYMREMEKTIEGSRFCAQHVKNKDKFESVSIRKYVVSVGFLGTINSSLTYIQSN